MTVGERQAAYRKAMLERKAAAAGCSVDELIARSEREADRTMAILRAKNDRRHGMSVLASAIQARRGAFTIFEVP